MSGRKRKPAPTLSAEHAAAFEAMRLVPMPTAPAEPGAIVYQLGAQWEIRVVKSEFGNDRRAIGILHPPAGKRYDEAGDAQAEARLIIERQLREAVAILKRLPIPSELVRLQGVVSAWADYVQDYPERRVTRIPLSGREVTFMDARLEWLRLIPDPYERQVVAARIAGAKWPDIVALDPLKRHRHTVMKIYFKGINTILAALWLQFSGRRGG